MLEQHAESECPENSLDSVRMSDPPLVRMTERQGFQISGNVRESVVVNSGQPEAPPRAGWRYL
jgi:hypothetical protein